MNKGFLYKRNILNFKAFQYSEFNLQEIFERLKSENLA